MIKKKFGWWRICGERCTVFLKFLDCMQSVKVLSNLKLEKLVTVFLLFSVCSWSVFKAIGGLVLSFQVKI